MTGSVEFVGLRSTGNGHLSMSDFLSPGRAVLRSSNVAPSMRLESYTSSSSAMSGCNDQQQ